MVNGKVYFEKRIRNNFETITFCSHGFNKDASDRKGFHTHGFDKKGNDENGFNRNKVLVCEEKIKQAIGENPWNIVYVSDNFRNKHEIMKECVESDPNAYQ